MAIRCLIVDDEPLAIEAMETLLGRFHDITVAGTCLDTFQAFDMLQQQEIDLMFLDIQMPEVSGLNFLKSLQHPPRVILTTAFREYALEAFDLDVVDYLLKPVSHSRLMKAINKYYELAGGSGDKDPDERGKAGDSMAGEDHLFVRADRKMQKILFDDILYVEGLKDYVKIITTGKMVITKQTIGHLGEQLPSGKFLRCHRSYIVNLSKVTAYTKYDIEIDRAEIPIGGSYREVVGKALQ